MSDEDLTIGELVDILVGIGTKYGNHLPVRYDGAAGQLRRRDVWAGVVYGEMVVNLNERLDVF